MLYLFAFFVRKILPFNAVLKSHDKRMNALSSSCLREQDFKKIILLPDTISDEGWSQTVPSLWTVLVSSVLSFSGYSGSISWWCSGSALPVYPALCLHLHRMSCPDASACSLLSSVPYGSFKCFCIQRKTTDIIPILFIPFHAFFRGNQPISSFLFNCPWALSTVQV